MSKVKVTTRPYLVIKKVEEYTLAAACPILSSLQLLIRCFVVVTNNYWLQLDFVCLYQPSDWLAMK